MADATRGPRMPRQAQAETARSSGGESPDRPGSVGIELTPEMRGGSGGA
jgi:hypothetical protein